MVTQLPETGGIGTLPIAGTCTCIRGGSPESPHKHHSLHFRVHLCLVFSITHELFSLTNSCFPLGERCGHNA